MDEQNNDHNQDQRQDVEHLKEHTTKILDLLTTEKGKYVAEAIYTLVMS